MTSRLIAELADLCDQVGEHVGDPAQQQTVRRLREELHDPLLVAIVGRVSSGKSTAVNALLERRIADTGAGETTKVVTRFRYGAAGEFIQVTRSDGSTRELSLGPGGRVPEDLSVEPGESIVIWLRHEVLREMSLVDTPGLASANESNSRQTREMLAIDQSTRHSASQADALVLLISQTAHHDDATTLAGFQSQYGGIGGLSINTIGVLGKADLLGGGFVPSDNSGADILAVARERASELFGSLQASLSALVPLANLLAETSTTGALTEPDAAAIRQLSQMSSTERERLLFSVDSFRDRPAPVERSTRGRLLRLLGLGGITFCLQLVNLGQRSAAQLSDALAESSGISHLRGELQRMTPRSDMLKAEKVLHHLDVLSYRLPSDTGRWLRGEVDRLRELPEMWQVSLLQAARRTTGQELPPELAADFNRLVEAQMSDERSVGALREEAHDRIGEWKRYGLVSPSSRGRHIADEAVTLYERVMDA